MTKQTICGREYMVLASATKSIGMSTHVTVTTVHSMATDGHHQITAAYLVTSVVIAGAQKPSMLIRCQMGVYANVPKICYAPRNFSADKLTLIEKCDVICQSFAQQGYDLTLRQLFYQLVSRDVIPNTQNDYKNLGVLVSDARMAGLINWEHIVDRTRNLMRNSHWEKPSSLVESAAKQYSIDKWENQDDYCEVFIEKQALEGVIEGICTRLDVPFFSCRGYTSSSEMWAAGQRLLGKIEQCKKVHIIHLGDHDPSGIDMSRDIKTRLQMFVDAHTNGFDSVHVLRVALNMSQIERLNPPPNPAKLTDSRAKSYIDKYGESSWELDALSPVELNNIVERAVMRYRDEDKWKEATNREEKGRRTLQAIYDDFEGVVKYLRGEVV